MIERLWELLLELRGYLGANFDPIRDTLDVLVVTLAVYWVLLLTRGTRAVQIAVGLVVLIAASLASEMFQLLTLRLILENFFSWAPVLIIVLFQHDIRRALARVGRGFFPAVSAQQESQMLEEVVRAAQILSRRRVGALIVLERDTSLDDQIEAGAPLDAAVTKELLLAIFVPPSPLHDGAVVIQQGRVASAGCILPLASRSDMPEGLGTRHRAAVGITEETDAVVIVVSEETASIAVVMAGEILAGLDAPRLRVVLRDVMSGERRDPVPRAEATEPRPARGAEPAELSERLASGDAHASDRARAGSGAR